MGRAVPLGVLSYLKGTIRGRLLIGISVFWLALSMLFDGINTLVLPNRLLHFTDSMHQATALGLITFVGLLGEGQTGWTLFAIGLVVVLTFALTVALVREPTAKYTGPASKLPHEGFERPSHCQFGPDGTLYVVDWGQIKIAPERGGIQMPLGTGALWASAAQMALRGRCRRNRKRSLSIQACIWQFWAA